MQGEDGQHAKRQHGADENEWALPSLVASVGPALALSAASSAPRHPPRPRPLVRPPPPSHLTPDSEKTPRHNVQQDSSNLSSKPLPLPHRLDPPATNPSVYPLTPTPLSRHGPFGQSITPFCSLGAFGGLVTNTVCTIHMTLTLYSTR